MQGQSGTTLLIDGRGESHLRQGITSEIIGEGDSPAFWTAQTASGEALARRWQSVGLDGLRRVFRARCSSAASPSTSARSCPRRWSRSEIIGLDNRAPTPEELPRMEAMVEQAMQDGAFGLSSALIYMPGSFASTEELVALARRRGRHKGIYVSHIRGESFNLFNALDEALRIGREGEAAGGRLPPEGRPRAGNWGRMGERWPS